MSGSNGNRFTADQEMKLKSLLAYVERAVRSRQRRNVLISVFEDGEFGIARQELFTDPRGPIPDSGRVTEGVMEILRG